MVMNYMLRMYFGLEFRINQWLMTSETETTEPQDEQGIQELLEEVREKVSSLQSTVEQTNAMMREDDRVQSQEEK